MTRLLPSARLVWLLGAALALGLAVATLPDFLREASAVVPAQQGTFSQLSPAEYAILRQAGLSPRVYAAFVLAWTLAPLFVYLILASIIFQRCPEESVAIWISLMLVGIGGAMPYLGGITEFSPPWQGLVHIARALGLSLLLGLFLVFPDGRPVPRWASLLAALWGVWMVLWVIFPGALWGLLDRSGAFTPIGLGATVLGFGAGMVAQIYRYRRVSTLLQRQQGKVIAFGFAATFLLYMVAVAPFFLWPAVRERGWPYLLYGLVWVPLLTRVAFMLVPLMIGFAVLRYRLWDIDLIIRRTLIYGALTGTLALFYASTVVILQPLFTLLTGRQQSALSTVLSTLATAALFGPLRGAVQQVIDRRFYRRKYDSSQALAGFSSRVADEVDVERLTAHLTAVVAETLQPEHVSLWLKSGQRPDERRTGR